MTQHSLVAMGNVRVSVAGDEALDFALVAGGYVPHVLNSWNRIPIFIL